MMGEGYIVICAITLTITLPLMLISLEEYWEDVEYMEWLEKQKEQINNGE